jgi:hypothetical protein
MTTYITATTVAVFITEKRRIVYIATPLLLDHRIRASMTTRRVTMRGDRRRTAAAQIAADVVIVLLAAYLLSIPAAAIFAIFLGYFFVRWWRRADVDQSK